MVDIQSIQSVFLTSPLKRKTSMEIVNRLNSDSTNNKTDLFIIGISGGPSSGKSKIANHFRKKLPKTLAIIEEIDFIKRKGRKLSCNIPLVGESDGYTNEKKMLMIELCNPENYNHEKLREVLQKIKNKEKVEITEFDKELGKDKEKIQIDPKVTPLILVVGDFIFRDEVIRNMFNFKIFIEIEDDVRVGRMILNEREFLQANKNAFSTFFNIYKIYMKPSFELNIACYKKYANLIISNYAITDNKEIEEDETLQILLDYFQKKTMFR